MPVEFPNSLGNIVYDHDYFSGSQVLVYFEDVLVDDCVRIAFSAEQNRTPIYGYASQYFNGVADGVIIVTGSFWIAYKEAAYIPLILRHVTSRREFSGGHYASPAMTPRSGRGFSSGLAESSRVYEGTTMESGARQSGIVRRASVERLVQRYSADPEDADAQESLAQMALQLGTLSDREFEDQAEMFEDAVWYGGNREASGRGDAMSPNFEGGSIERGRWLAFRRADQYPPFDIILSFGDINNPAANHSVQRIVDTIIVNTEFGGVEPTGEPVYVRYDYIARNLM